MSQNQNIKRDILHALSTELSKSEFKLKGNSFIREPQTGLYQVINFGLGPATSMMANHIGLGFGITVEEWLNQLMLATRPKTLSSADCEIRDINCNLLKISDDTVWYPITFGSSSLTQSIGNYIKNTIIPYFDRLKTRQDIINMWRQYEKDIGLAEGRHSLAMGTLMFFNGYKDEGEQLLKDLLESNKDNSYFTSTITKILTTK